MSPDLTLGDGQNSGKYPGFQVRGSLTLGLLSPGLKASPKSKPALISGVNGPTQPHIHACLGPPDHMDPQGAFGSSFYAPFYPIDGPHDRCNA